jgi:hypothetical protein
MVVGMESFVILFSYYMQVLVCLFLFLWHGLEISGTVNLGICSLYQFLYHSNGYFLFL